MLYLIGLGLSEGDLSAKALKALKSCDAVYVEKYTGEWLGDLGSVEKETGFDIEKLDRATVENGFLVGRAQDMDVALLVTGDPLAATTHFELFAECKKRGISVRVIHAPSILTAVAETGLSIYKFGRVTTLAKPEGGWSPESPYDVIDSNNVIGLHSLVLMDIGMGVRGGIRVLSDLEREKNKKLFTDSSEIVACTSLGSGKSRIVYGTVANLRDAGLDSPACIIVPGEMNFKEEEFLELWKPD